MLNEANCDLYQLLDTLENVFQPEARARQLTLSFERGSTVPHQVMLSEKLLRQVLIKLLSSVIRSTQTGKVTLRVQKDENNQLMQQKNNDSLSFNSLSLVQFEVEVTDLEAVQSKLQTSFAIPNQSIEALIFNQEIELEIAIIKQLVHAMNGEMRVSSSIDTGALFQVKLPYKLPEATLPTRSQSQRIVSLVPGQPVYRILIVDDATTNRTLLSKILKTVGFEVQEAGNGQEAVKLWQQFAPQLILMDMQMPVIDGYEATQQIRQLEHLDRPAAEHSSGSTIIIALTANAFETERKEVLAVGCDDFVSKPFQREALLTKIAEHLGARYQYKEI
jgi:CheY-like chemotaxis protein